MAFFILFSCTLQDQVVFLAMFALLSFSICKPSGPSGVRFGLNAAGLISVFHRILQRLTPDYKLLGLLCILVPVLPSSVSACLYFILFYFFLNNVTCCRCPGQIHIFLLQNTPYPCPLKIRSGWWALG